MGDIFREVDEELRHERLDRLWRTYGKYVIGIAVLLVVAVVSWQLWSHYQKTQQEADSMQYSTAERLAAEGRAEEAAALFANLADRASGSYGQLARFHQAALRAQGGDRAGAVRIYDALAADSGLDRTLRDAAVIFAVTLLVDEPGADVNALQARLEPMMGDDRPWRHAARELSGLLLLQAGDREAARQRFEALADDFEAPQGLRARAAQVLTVIGG